jgi:hypothetical protein
MFKGSGLLRAGVAVVSVAIVLGACTATNRSAQPAASTQVATTPSTTTTTLAPPTSASTAHATTSVAPVTNASTTSTTQIGATFADSYFVHGGSLVIKPDGTGTISFRTYNFCTPVGGTPPSPGPCDSMVNNVITNGGHVTFTLQKNSSTTAVGTVAASNDQQRFPLGPLTASRIANDELVLTFKSGTKSTFCGTHAGPTNDCGA